MKVIYLFFSFASIIQIYFSQLLVTSNDRASTGEKIKEKYNKIIRQYLPTMLNGAEYSNFTGQCNGINISFYNITKLLLINIYLLDFSSFHIF